VENTGMEICCDDGMPLLPLCLVVGLKSDFFDFDKFMVLSWFLLLFFLYAA